MAKDPVFGMEVNEKTAKYKTVHMESIRKKSPQIPEDVNREQSWR